MNPIQIVVAGASGYIGREIIPRLLKKFPEAKVTALSRSGLPFPDARVECKSCDLFSLKSLEQAMPHHVDLALYLVHSMGPTAQLDQGNFADYDLILADNFARAVKSRGVKQLIYLGGIIPESTTLSLHLQSRLEVEDAFRHHAIPTTAFRAGLILGEAGSSTQILLKLVKRLPVMICPRWTQTRTAPVDLETVLTSLAEASLNQNCYGKIYDLAGCQPLTYLEMMRETARFLGKKRYFFTVPFFTPTLSRLWVSLITNTPKDLVYPLIESLEHPMVPAKDRYFSKDWLNRTYFDLLPKVSFKVHARKNLFRFRPSGKTVRSVQRLPLPSGQNAQWVKERYLDWLPKFVWPLIRVTTSGDVARLSLRFWHEPLLVLEFSKERSQPDRQVLYIKGGLLVARKGGGRLEFRVVLNRKFVLAAIHEYQPSLPWFIYKYTQAKVHLLTMRAFGQNLARFSEKG